MFRQITANKETNSMSNPTKPIETARGLLEWVTITGEGKENLSGKMQYTANLVLTNPEDIAAVKEQINTFWEANKPKGFSKPPKSTGVYEHTVASGEKDENGKNVYKPSGHMYLSFKTGTSYTDGKPKVIKVLNSKNNPVVLGETKIGNGSIGRIAGVMGIYTNKTKQGVVLEAGVTLYLDGIKLLKLEEFSGGPAFGNDDDEFEAVGEQFVGEEAPVEQAAETATSRPRL